MLGGLRPFAPPLFARALELDPSNQEAAWYHVVALEWADRHEEAFSAGSEYVQRYGEDSEIEFWMAVASASLGRRAVADTLFERALALMGDLDSDLYGPLMVSSYYLRNGREARGLELSRKWIVPLQRMATAAPDNYRVAGVLAGMLGVSGESVAMRDSLFGMVRRIRANPDFSVGGLMLVVPGVLESGTGADVDTLVACARTRDLGTLQDMTMHWYDLTIGTSGSHASPEMIARVKELQSEVAARLDLLTTRFGPSLVLKTP
jgi:hypothetical protein